jgi:Zn-dependent peptidase ImmA (M78 family)/DNA-binding XRE family transcriptional regulator
VRTKINVTNKHPFGLQIFFYWVYCKLKGGLKMSIGERIKSARIMADKSQRELAETAHVSAMAISKYERNMDTPSSSVLLRLAKALGVKVEYFFRPTTISLSLPTYRRKVSLASAHAASILEQVQEWLERYVDIEMLLDRNPVLQLPTKAHIETFDTIEDIALNLRAQWNLGIDPIERLIEVCEDKGIKVGLIDDHENFDALTLWANTTIPVIALRRNMAGDRQRFCLAHELGHLIMDTAPEIDSEKAAHRFAGAFLAPKPVVEFELGAKRHTLGLQELYLLKQKYGLSMQAWMYRAKDLGILSEANAVSTFELFSQRNWRHEEPGKALSPEEPQRFKRLVIHAQCEGIISRSRAAELLNEPLPQFSGGEMDSLNLDLEDPSL